MKKYLLHIGLISFLLLWGSKGLTAHSVEYQINSMEDTTITKAPIWRGIVLFDKHKDSVSIHFQLADSLPGHYHKQVVAGEITYDKEQITHELIGYQENQRDTAIHFYEFEKDGKVAREFYGGVKKGRMEGYLITSADGNIKGAFQLKKKSTFIKIQPIQTTIDHIAGEYRYNFGKSGTEGILTIKNNDDGTIAMKIHSIANDNSGYVEINEDTLEISGTTFMYDAKVYGVTVWPIKVQFYKDFVVVSFTKSKPESGKFGERATPEGFFYKIQE